MTYSNADSASEDPSTALLALKRFVRSTLRQAGIGLVALMVVLNLGTHTLERSPSNSAQLTSELIAELTSAVMTADALTALASQPVSSQPVSSQPSLPQPSERRIGRGITYHHFTGARLSITTASEGASKRAIVSVAKAG